MSLRLVRTSRETNGRAMAAPILAWLRALLLVFAVVALPADLINPALQSAISSEVADLESPDLLDEKEFADGLAGLGFAQIAVATRGDGGVRLRAPSAPEPRQRVRQPFGARDPPAMRT